jgi:hypothetical protein
MLVVVCNCFSFILASCGLSPTTSTLVSMVLGLYQDQAQGRRLSRSLQDFESEASKRLGPTSSRKGSRTNAEWRSHCYLNRCPRVRWFWRRSSLQVVWFCKLVARSKRRIGLVRWVSKLPSSDDSYYAQVSV